MTFSYKDFYQRFFNGKFVFFIAILVMMIPFVINISSGPVRNSINNAEQWVNLTNIFSIDSQPFIFSYGPLYWLMGGVSEYYNAVTYYISILFVLAIYSYLVWAVFYSMFKSNGYLFFTLVCIIFFSFYALKTVIFLWPLVLLFYFQLKSEKEVLLHVSECIILGVIAGLFLYIRFFYGLISVAIIGGYLSSQLLIYFKLKEIISFVVSFLLSSIIFGMFIYGESAFVIDYFLVNSQLSFGNAVDMTLDVTNFLFVYVCSLLVLVCFVIYGVCKRRMFLIPLLATWLLLFKLGYGRADHYVSYFVIPCAFISLFISFDKGLLTKMIFLVSFSSLCYLGTHSAYENSPRIKFSFSSFNLPKISNPFVLPFSGGISYEDRMASVYNEYKFNGDAFETIEKDTFDVYPYNNEYIFANKLNYQHRPLFQNYMTLTPFLDKKNSDFFNSVNRPRHIIWNSGIMCGSSDCNSFNNLDNKFVLNEDPLTILSIFENYKFDKLIRGKNEEPVALLSARSSSLPSQFSIIQKVKMKFGVWYSLPSIKQGVVKVEPDFKITLIGRAKNLLFRGNILKVKYRLKSGLEKEYRLNIINSRSGVWASPLLDGFDAEGFNGDDVSDIQFVSDGNYYFEPEFESSILVSKQNLFSYQPRKVKYNKQVFVAETGTAHQIDCQGSIDSVIQPQRMGETQTPLIVKGWLAQSTSAGLLFDHIDITLTNNQQQTIHFETSKTMRGDLIDVFGQRELENAGYISNLDVSALQGSYLLSLEGHKGAESFSCQNLKFNLDFK